MSAPLRYACFVCGVWTCDACGWKRHGASVRCTGHTCTLCGSADGVILPTMHTELQWRKHNYRDTGGLYKDMMLPQGYPFGTRPEGELQAPFGHRVSDRAPRLYHNVPVPRQGPHQMLDLKSWKRGVDDAIAALEATVGRSAARGGYDAGYKAAKEEGS